MNPRHETNPHFYGDPKQQVEVVNPRHETDPDMHARSPPSPQHQAPVPLALLPLHLRDQTHQPLRPHHQDQQYGSLAPHGEGHFRLPHGAEPRHEGRPPHHPPLLPRQQRGRHTRDWAPGVPPQLTPRHHGPDRLTEPMQQPRHDQYYQDFQPRTERFPRDLLGAVPLQPKEDKDQVPEPDLIRNIRAIIEKRHPETNPYFRGAEQEDVVTLHPETNPHFDRKPQVEVINPHRETNPHFLRSTQPPAEDLDLRLPLPTRPGWLRPPITEHPPRDPVLSVQLPEDQDHDHDQVLMIEVPKAPLQPRDSAAQPHQPRPDQQSHWRQTLEVPYDRQLVRQRRVHPCAACSAVIFCVFLVLAALAVFIIYLIFRPWGPRFEVSTVTTLNRLNLTKGNLLSANLTLVPNFRNPNKKAGVDFKHVVIELYFGRTIIATKNIEPDPSAPKGGTRSVKVDMVASGVQLSELEIQRLKSQMVRDKVVFEVKGSFLVHTKFGPLVRYFYWVHGQCIVTLKKPPHGVLVSTKCNTKRHQNFV
ncbi:Late embryogenesis abundant protein [Trema orientale]|uniref:Late embryogenesis abundant protein n=1 Tax=Trema orientale TaxID=63057 RepID=A0A2P5FMS1_TREOI|nr:Late embryogenesis abundant protein [Trema orientale]